MRARVMSIKTDPRPLRRRAGGAILPAVGQRVIIPREFRGIGVLSQGGEHVNSEKLGSLR
jgi:hypothetical protein